MLTAYIFLLVFTKLIHIKIQIEIVHLLVQAVGNLPLLPNPTNRQYCWTLQDLSSHHDFADTNDAQLLCSCITSRRSTLHHFYCANPVSKCWSKHVHTKPEFATHNSRPIENTAGNICSCILLSQTEAQVYNAWIPAKNTCTQARTWTHGLQHTHTPSHAAPLVSQWLLFLLGKPASL